MRTRILILLVMSIFLTLTQCVGEPDPLSIPLTPFTGNQLRIDGYFYRIGWDGETIFDGLFFY